MKKSKVIESSLCSFLNDKLGPRKRRDNRDRSDRDYSHRNMDHSIHIRFDGHNRQANGDASVLFLYNQVISFLNYIKIFNT